MKIICLVKFIPDVDAFEYDYTNNVLVRENVKLVINPDDACALGFILRLKKKVPELEVEVVTMGPLSVRSLLEDILRRRVDRATLLSDTKFSGSDTLATSLIIGTYLKQADYDVIFTGSHTLDGDTAHIPSQLAEFLDLDQLSSITKIDEASFLEGRPRVETDTEWYTDVYEMPFPAILSVSKESNYKLPFVRYADLDLEVDDKLTVLDNSTLNVDEEKIGLAGSPTRVAKTYNRTYEEKEKIIVANDDKGIETVYRFLKDEGYLP